MQTQRWGKGYREKSIRPKKNDKGRNNKMNLLLPPLTTNVLQGSAPGEVQVRQNANKHRIKLNIKCRCRIGFFADVEKIVGTATYLRCTVQQIFIPFGGDVQSCLLVWMVSFVYMLLVYCVAIFLFYISSFSRKKKAFRFKGVSPTGLLSDATSFYLHHIGEDQWPDARLSLHFFLVVVVSSLGL